MLDTLSQIKSKNLIRAGVICTLVTVGSTFSKHSNAADIWVTKPKSSATLLADSDIIKLNRAFTDLADQMSPTVVSVFVKSKTVALRPGGPIWDQGGPDGFFGAPFGMGRGLMPQPREMQALGSGFVINTNGLIVTNAHVVRMAGHNADEIMVKFIGEDNEKGHAAKIIGVDEPTDVAVLKLVEPRAGLRAAPLGDSDKSKVGEWVVAIGNPYGHSNTLTQGMVSALGRSVEGLGSEFMQTSASINPGNSGGPLINMAGEVIAINSAIDPRAQGIGFAIPINAAKTVISELVLSGKVLHPWLGMEIQDVNDEVASVLKMKSSEGVLVRRVLDHEPAAIAGIEAGDVVKKMNGKTLHDCHDLLTSIGKLQVGAKAELEIQRGNQTKSLEVKMTERPAES